MIVVRALERGSLAAVLLRGGRGTLLGAFSRALGLRTERGGIVWVDQRPDALSRRGVLTASWPDDAVRPGETWESDGRRLRFATLALDLETSPVEETPPLEVSLPEPGAATGLRGLLASRPVGVESDFLAVAFQRFLREVAEGRPLAEAGGPLLGLGPGLTPSGDDFLGGFLLLSRALGRAPSSGPLLAAGRERTNPFSLARLVDHAEGHGTRAERRVLEALASGDGPALSASVDALARHGHTSAWDFLAGAAGALGAHREGR